VLGGLRVLAVLHALRWSPPCPASRTGPSLEELDVAGILKVSSAEIRGRDQRCADRFPGDLSAPTFLAAVSIARIAISA